MQTWKLYERRELVGLVDTALNGNFDAEQACRFLKIGLLCTQDDPKLRPSMSSVVKMLTGKDVDEHKITKPGLISDFMDLKVRSNAPKAKPGSDHTPGNYASSGSDNLDTTRLTSAASSQATMTFTFPCTQSM